MFQCYVFLSFCYILTCVDAYSRILYSIRNFSFNEFDLRCVNTEIDMPTTVAYHRKLKFGHRNRSSLRTGWSIVRASALQMDPFESYQQLFHQYLFGPKVDEGIESESPLTAETTTVEILSGKKRKTQDRMAHYPDGQVMRSEMFNNKSGVHFPPREFIHHGHARLKITSDYMQTAINAFSILLEGTVSDVQRLPADYVLKSTRTIAMMKITKEKLAALWDVVKNGRKPAEMKHHELELYRPLFKYVNAREMARLNLKDDKILTYIGTHSELDRHQVGVVASRYIQVNQNWSEVQYLNRMNNLLCGVPMNFMRRISSEVYLQFTHQVFYHIRACDPLQRRFYLAMMTRTEALGKSFSWSARDVSRLGLLLAEVQGPDLASINPEAMSGITAQVMIEMPAHNLQFLTETQLRYLGLKPLNILARKLKSYHDKIRLRNDATTRDFAVFLLLLALPFVL